MPTFGGCMQYLCSQLQQRHAELLASKSKCFCSGTNFITRAFWVSFVGAHQLCDPSRRCSPHNPLTKGAPTNMEVFVWNNNREPCCSWRQVDTIVYKSGIAIVLFQEHTVDSWAIYLKSFEELNFHGMGRIHKKCKNYVPRKYGAIHYILVCLTRLISSCATEGSMWFKVRDHM